MQDLVYLALTGAFFALCARYVRALDRLVGPPEGAPEELTAEAGRPERERVEVGS